jgi:hypothetical protein
MPNVLNQLSCLILIIIFTSCSGLKRTSDFETTNYFNEMDSMVFNMVWEKKDSLESITKINISEEGLRIQRKNASIALYYEDSIGNKEVKIYEIIENIQVLRIGEVNEDSQYNGQLLSYKFPTGILIERKHYIDGYLHSAFVKDTVTSRWRRTDHPHSIEMPF